MELYNFAILAARGVEILVIRHCADQQQAEKLLRLYREEWDKIWLTKNGKRVK